MKRINLIYGGTTYSVGGRDLDELQAEIGAALTAGNPLWLTVNSGEGIPREARLLITGGVDLALIPIAEPAQDPDETTDQPTPPPAR
jgi:hypothetical protein